MVIASTRPDIIVEEQDGGATLTIVARNPFVSWVVTIVGGFVALSALVPGLAGSSAVSVVGSLALSAGAVWLTWRIGWRPRPFAIRFSPGYLEAGQQRHACADIASYGLSGDGGDVVDVVTVGVPRNVTPGRHIYIKLGQRFLPVTVGMKDAQAREALRLFGLLFEANRAA